LEVGKKDQPAPKHSTMAAGRSPSTAPTALTASYVGTVGEIIGRVHRTKMKENKVYPHFLFSREEEENEGESSARVHVIM
jgi:hypothetical protein